MTVRNDHLLKRWNDHLLKRWNDHLLRRRRCAWLKCWWLIWWNNQSCIRCWCHQMHWRFSDVINDAAPNAEIIECTDKIVWLSGLLHPTPNGQMHWRFSDVGDAASDAETIECTDEIVWFVACYRTESTRRNGVGWIQPNPTQTTDGLGLVWVFNWLT